MLFFGFFWKNGKQKKHEKTRFFVFLRFWFFSFFLENSEKKWCFFRFCLLLAWNDFFGPPENMEKHAKNVFFALFWHFGQNGHFWRFWSISTSAQILSTRSLRNLAGSPFLQNWVKPPKNGQNGQKTDHGAHLKCWKPVFTEKHGFFHFWKWWFQEILINFINFHDILINDFWSFLGF